MHKEGRVGSSQQAAESRKRPGSASGEVGNRELEGHRHPTEAHGRGWAGGGPGSDLGGAEGGAAAGSVVAKAGIAGLCEPRPGWFVRFP